MDKSLKRKSYLGWDEYFMSVAFLSALRSKDPEIRDGACIVNEKNRIVGIGYNGFPAGCSDDILPWASKGEFLSTKFAYVCHAEVNAILNANERDLSDCSLYAAHFPCNECAKVIIQSGIKEIVYVTDLEQPTESIKAAKKMFDLSGVLYRKIPFNKNNVIDLFAEEPL